MSTSPTQQRRVRISGPAGQPAMVVLLAASLAIASLATGRILSDPSTEHDLVAIAAACIVWLICYGAATVLYFRSNYLFGTAYVTVLSVFHLGLLIPVALGMQGPLVWNGGMSHWIAAAGWYTALALSAFGVGYSGFCLQQRSHQARPPPAEETALATANLLRLRNLGVGLALAAIAGVLLAFARLGNLLAFTRFELFFKSADTRWLGLFIYLGPTAAAILVVTARTRKQKLASYLFGAVTLVTMLLSGNRSMALFPLLAGAVLWVKLGRRIPTLVAAGAVIAVLLVIPIIAMLRTLGSYEDLSSRDIARAQQRSSILNSLAEMGATVGVLGVTLRHIPKDEPYRLAGPYLLYLRQAIPNFGTSMNRDYSRAALMQRLRSDPASVIDLAPSDWATWKIIPESFLQGSGTGFSGIAEPYFCFGYGGVVVWFLALGVFLAKMDSTNIRLNYRWLLFGGLFFWYFLQTSRNEFGVFFKPASLTITALAIWIIVRRFTPFSKPALRLSTRAAAR